MQLVSVYSEADAEFDRGSILRTVSYINAKEFSSDWICNSALFWEWDLSTEKIFESISDMPPISSSTSSLTSLGCFLQSIYTILALVKGSVYKYSIELFNLSLDNCFLRLVGLIIFTNFLAEFRFLEVIGTFSDSESWKEFSSKI